EVRWSVKPPVPARDGPLLGSERRLELVARPDVELAFLVLAVGIHTGVERTLGRAHLSQNPRGDPARGALECNLAGRAPRVGVKRKQRRVVVEHLLEMRDRPFGVDAVAAEAPAELIVDASGGYALERRRDDFECALVVAQGVPAQAQLQIDRVRELRRGAEAPV